MGEQCDECRGSGEMVIRSPGRLPVYGLGTCPKCGGMGSIDPKKQAQRSPSLIPNVTR